MFTLNCSAHNAIQFYCKAAALFHSVLHFYNIYKHIHITKREIFVCSSRITTYCFAFTLLLCTFKITTDIPHIFCIELHAVVVAAAVCFLLFVRKESKRQAKKCTRLPNSTYIYTHFALCVCVFFSRSSTTTPDFQFKHKQKKISFRYKQPLFATRKKKLTNNKRKKNTTERKNGTEKESKWR